MWNPHFSSIFFGFVNANKIDNTNSRFKPIFILRETHSAIIWNSSIDGIIIGSYPNSAGRSGEFKEISFVALQATANRWNKEIKGAPRLIITFRNCLELFFFPPGHDGAQINWDLQGFFFRPTHRSMFVVVEKSFLWIKANCFWERFNCRKITAVRLFLMNAFLRRRRRFYWFGEGRFCWKTFNYGSNYGFFRLLDKWEHRQTISEGRYNSVNDLFWL